MREIVKEMEKGSRKEGKQEKEGAGEGGI